MRHTCRNLLLRIWEHLTFDSSVNRFNGFILLCFNPLWKQGKTQQLASREIKFQSKYSCDHRRRKKTQHNLNYNAAMKEMVVCVYSHLLVK